EVRFIMQLGNQLGLNVRHYEVASEVGTGADLLSMAEDLGTIFGPLYIALLSSSAEFRGVGARKIRPIPVSGEALSNAGAGFGAVTGDPLPRQVSGLISLRTASTTVAKRGRAYIPFPSEDDSTAV